MSYRRHLKHIWSFPNFGEGGAAFVKLERVALRWVLVVWGQSKYQNSSNVFIWRLGYGSCPTDVTSSTSDHFPILGKGSCICQIGKGCPEVSSGHLSHLMYSFDNNNALPLDVSGVWIMSYRRRLKHIWSFPSFGEGGAAFIKLEKAALRLVLVVWGQSKYQNSSNVFM